jgi:hypothetical protein
LRRVWWATTQPQQHRHPPGSRSQSFSRSCCELSVFPSVCLHSSITSLWCLSLNSVWKLLSDDSKVISVLPAGFANQNVQQHIKRDFKSSCSDSKKTRFGGFEETRKLWNLGIGTLALPGMLFRWFTRLVAPMRLPNKIELLCERIRSKHTYRFESV